MEEKRNRKETRKWSMFIVFCSYLNCKQKLKIKIRKGIIKEKIIRVYLILFVQSPLRLFLNEKYKK